MASGYNCYGYNVYGYVNPCSAPPPTPTPTAPSGGGRGRRRHGIKLKGKVFVVEEGGLEALLEQLLTDEERGLSVHPAQNPSKTALRIGPGTGNSRLLDVPVQVTQFPQFQKIIRDLEKRLDEEGARLARAVLERKMRDLEDEDDMERIMRILH